MVSEKNPVFTHQISYFSNRIGNYENLGVMPILEEMVDGNRLHHFPSI